MFFRSAGRAHDAHLPAQLEGKASFLQSHGLGKAEKVVEDHLAVQSLIRAYQVSVFWGRCEDNLLPFYALICILVLTIVLLLIQHALN